MARDFTGSFIEAKVRCYEGIVEPDLAEAIGVREALSWIEQKGWHNVQVETDSLVAVQAVRSSTQFLSYFGCIIQECRQLLEDLRHKHVALSFVK